MKCFTEVTRGVETTVVLSELKQRETIALSTSYLMSSDKKLKLPSKKNEVMKNEESLFSSSGFHFSKTARGFFSSSN